MLNVSESVSTQEPSRNRFSDRAASKQQKLFLETHELITATGLMSAFNEAGGSWAELSRMTGVPVSTLKSRGKRFGVSRGLGAMSAEIARTDAGAIETVDARAVKTRDQETEEILAACAEERRTALEAVLSGATNEIDSSRLLLAVQVDAVLLQNDHARLARAASVAIQYFPQQSFERNQHKFIRKMAAVCDVDPKSLDAFCVVLQSAIHYHKNTRQDPFEHLPKVIDSNQEAMTALEAEQTQALAQATWGNS